jgi:hypothetical protein
MSDEQNINNITTADVTSDSWFDRITGSLTGIIFGFILFIIGICLIFWNEGRIVKTANALHEGEKSVIAVNSDSINQDNNGKLIHISGNVTTGESIHDVSTGVFTNALRLSRNIEIYQWIETKHSHTDKKLGGGTETTTTYSYEQKWVPKSINSINFREAAAHKNSGSLLLSNEVILAKDANLGAFHLPPQAISKMKGDTTFDLTQDDLEKLPVNLKDRAKIFDGGYYFGNDPNNPLIGDQRVKFSVLPCGIFSIVAKQNKKSIESYITRNGHEIMIVESGDVSPDNMFQKAEDENQVLGWILRLIGVSIIFFGTYLLLNPLAVLADVIPFLGDIFSAGIAIIALLLSLTVSLITIAIGWIYYRPLIGVILITISFLLMFLILSRIKSNRLR